MFVCSLASIWFQYSGLESSIAEQKFCQRTLWTSNGLGSVMTVFPSQFFIFSGRAFLSIAFYKGSFNAFLAIVFFCISVVPAPMVSTRVLL